MLETIIEFSRYFFALLFGTTIAFRFAGLTYTKKNTTFLLCLTFVLFIIQLLSLFQYGMEITIKLYPLITHLLIVLIIFLFLKKSLLIAFTSVFVSYICCQPSRWIGTLSGEIFKEVSMNHLGYILSTIIMFYLIERYAVKSIQHLMNRSTYSCLLFGAMPTLFYFFEFTATVYTDFLYSGKRVAIQFLPFVTAAFYLIFVLLYSEESKKQIQTQRNLDRVDLQFKQAQKEFESYRQLEFQAATFRHDLRHHFSYLQELAKRGEFIEINQYLNTAQDDLDSFTPIRFCANETINLILSSFQSTAENKGILFTVDSKIPAKLPFSDTELCSLLSNALENAVNACEKIKDQENRFIKLKMFYKNNKFCIDLRNSYLYTPVFINGLPISTSSDHGFGTKSIAHIVEKYGGVYRFSITKDLFVFQATI